MRQALSCTAEAIGRGAGAKGSGYTADKCAQLVGKLRDIVEVQKLDDPVYRGGPSDDERYVILNVR